GSPTSAMPCNERPRRFVTSGTRGGAVAGLAVIRGASGDSLLYVNLDECTSCTACYQPDVCPVGAIYAEQHVPDGTPNAKYNKADTAKGHDHTFFTQLSRDVFAD